MKCLINRLLGSLAEQAPETAIAPGASRSRVGRPAPGMKHRLKPAQIARLEFSGTDRAAGKHWEDWVRAHNEKKAAGEKNMALVPEALE